MAKIFEPSVDENADINDIGLMGSLYERTKFMSQIEISNMVDSHVRFESILVEVCLGSMSTATFL